MNLRVIIPTLKEGVLALILWIVYSMYLWWILIFIEIVFDPKWITMTWSYDIGFGFGIIWFIMFMMLTLFTIFVTVIVCGDNRK